MFPTRYRRTALSVSIAMMLSLGLTTNASASPPHLPSRSPSPPQPSAKPVTPVPAGDEVVTSTADENGYHLYAAAAGNRWQWQPLATLLPAGRTGQPWTGEHCLTGDGRYVVAVVAPWQANNTATGFAVGGAAYAVDAHTGAARLLIGGVSLAYFNPGCGRDASVALTRYVTADQSRTEILVANAATGVVTSLGTATSELTSAVPVKGAVLAARGRDLVRLGGGPTQGGLPRVQVVSTLPGVPSHLTANPSGGVDFLTVNPSSKSVRVWSQDAAGIHMVADGESQVVRLLPGRGGSSRLLGAVPATERPGARPGTGPRALHTGLVASVISEISANGEVAVTLGALGTTSLRRTRDGAELASRLPAPAAPAAERLTPTTTAANQNTPTCAVPRNDPAYQVLQPSSGMIEWATNLAGRGRLTGLRGTPGRPADDSPSSDFPLPAPFGPSGAHIPREVIDAVLAQETNWNQASPHAPPGMAGNPYVADYYGFASTGSIDYDRADCGYGLGQITDGMRATGPTPTFAQRQIAVDYAANVARAAQILAQKWNLLSSMGITVDFNSPGSLEAWYFVFWAYNSGINPQASTGGPSDCTPGIAGCTDSDGNWGLGWTNNPANPTYDPLRNPFLRIDVEPDPLLEVWQESYGDAAHPGRWPYQEKVLGWMETSQYEPDGVTKKFAGTADYANQTGFLSQPSHDAFCALLDNSCVAVPITGPGDCTRADFHCWWHAQTLLCATVLCHGGVDTVADGSAEPAVSNPHPPLCSAGLPGGTVIVDDVPGQQNAVGCPATAPGSNGGAFEVSYGQDGSGAPFGQIDWHQIGGGLGGHFWFTHTEQPADSKWGVTATWRPNAPPGAYQIRAFVPNIGAVAKARFEVFPGVGRSPRTAVVDQSVFGNEWVSLGTFVLLPGGRVTLSSVTNGGDGVTDLAFDALAFTPVGSYASLGDSYSSGVGAPPYDIESVDACERSPLAYGRIYAASTSYADGRTAHVACSGAVIDNIDLAGQNGEPRQLDQMPPNAELVTVSIGGNDAGFADVITRCLTPGLDCAPFYTADDSNDLWARIDALGPRLTRIYQEIRTRAPSAQVIAVTYPNIFAPGRTCLDIANLSTNDVDWLISTAYYLDNTIENAAQAAGVRVLDERYAFVGHELCTAQPWVNSLPIPWPGGTRVLDSSSWFHPTNAGYARMAADLAKVAGRIQPAWTPVKLPPAVPTPTEARDLLAALRPAAPDDVSPFLYNRDDFGDWTDRQLCDTRQRILRRDALDGPTPIQPAGSGCPITQGTWETPYEENHTVVETHTAKETGDLLEIDHIVPLKNAWNSGLWRIDNRYLKYFTNDEGNPQLLTVSQASNSSKQDSSPDQWMPNNVDFACTYDAMWVAVKYAWNLSVTDDERDALTAVLANC